MGSEEILPTNHAEGGQAAFRMRMAVAHGLRLAAEAGRREPALRDAVWELLIEAADTLRRQPNRERGWLTATSRAHWPAFVRDIDADTASVPQTGSDGFRFAPASAGAIDRMDMVLTWLSHAGGSKGRRDAAVLFGLACGLRVAKLRARFGCGRRTIYDIRDRSLTRLCRWLSAEIGFDENGSA